MKKSNSLTPITIAVLTALYGSPARADDAGALEEVTVTATRRESTAQALPMSITAVTGASLEQAGIGNVAELARSMAGVNVTDKGPFGGVEGSGLIIRGLNSEATAGQLALSTPIVPPVATYVDDTPLFVNLRLQDLDHVEILRGPQGTLYGSGSLGGTIRFVQNAPDPEGFDSRAEVGVSHTRHTHSPNETVNGMLNLPFSPTFAVRINAGWDREAGFIDQPNLYRLDSAGAPLLSNPSDFQSAPVIYSKQGVNSYAYRNARVSALWKPNDDFHAQLSYYYQLSTGDGFPYSAPLYGVDSLQSADKTQANTRDKADVAALTLEYELGFATLTSNTSWSHHVNRTSSDLTGLYSSFPFYPSLYGANPRVLVTGHDVLDDKPWSQEIRLASKDGGLIDWVAGAFFKHEDTNIQEHEYYEGYLDYFNACAPVFGVSEGDGVTPSECGIGETAYTPGNPPSSIDGIPIVKDQAYIGDFQTRFKDLAVFGEVTWHITPIWSLTGGARVFKQTLTQAQQTGLLFDGPTSIDNNSLQDSWKRALWKVNTAWQLDHSNLIYATWSQGFRRGSVNALPPTEPAVNYVTDPGLYKVSPDTADNYEIGIKGTIQNRFRYSAAVFDIEWKNIQEGAQLTPLVLPGAVNVGNGYSRGFETELYASLSEHLSAQLDYTYDKTAITALFPIAVGGLAVPPSGVGAPLPGTPKNSLAVSVEYGHIAVAGGELRFAASANYKSSLVPALSASIPTVGGYTMVDARINFTKEHWSGTLYVDNLTDQLGITSYSDPVNYAQFYQAVVSTPRTVGLTLSYSFKGE